MKILSNQDKEININIKIDEVLEYGDFINYIIVRALKNIVKYTDYNYKDIFEIISFDNIYFKLCNFFKIKEEFSNDKTYLEFQLNTYKIKYVRKFEYEIFLLLKLEDER